MYRDRDFTPPPPDLSAVEARSLGVSLRDAQEVVLRRGLPPQSQDLIADLELGTLLAAMAQGDKFLHDVARKAVLTSLDEPQAILYRHDVLADCLRQPDVVRAIYDLAVEALASERRVLGVSSWSSPGMVLSRSVQVLELFAGILRRLRVIAEEHRASFRSEGFLRLFEELVGELDDEYLKTVGDHLKLLRFRQGTLISARLGRGNKGTEYVLRRPPERRRGLRERIAGRRRPSFSFEIADRDEAGARALGELRNQGIDLVANAAAQSCDHVLSFFSMLRSELAFYVGCLNLHERLSEIGAQTSFPVPVDRGETDFSCRALYDVCLCLTLGTPVVGNDEAGADRSLTVITGANQGGKSTFLRSVGLAYLMMQSGMFVPAEHLRADVRDGIFTHFKREEDATMRSGKLDEELNRMHDIAEELRPGSLVLCNESFASTNEREGSEIARQIVRALLETGVKVFYVTHMFDLAESFYGTSGDGTLFLRAEREADGHRTFRLAEGEPLPTSYGEDLYRRIFGAAPDDAVSSRPLPM